MTNRLQSLEYEDAIHVNSAEGWLGLGDYNSAHDELEKIRPLMRAHPTVLLMRCQIYHVAKQWDSVITITDTLVQQLPENSAGWIHRSFALHKSKRTQEAFDLLLPAQSRFATMWLIPYNLGCYCSRLGRLPEAFTWLQRAIDLAGKKDIRAKALDDPDFEPLWNQIGEI